MLNILKIAIAAPLHHYFDYLAPTDFPLNQLKKGLRVLVPFGKQEKVGFLMELSTTSERPLSQLRTAIAILDEVPLLPDSIQRLLEWTSRYYHCPLGEVFANALPNSLRVGKDFKNSLKKAPKIHAAKINSKKIVINTTTDGALAKIIQLNTHQQQAIATIINSLGKFQAFLLNGVTGSGKTEVYLEAIQAVLDRGEQALVLVPEIGLTPQMLERFQARFSVPLLLFHSRLTEKQRLEHWLLSKTGAASIIIGTRSALFTPLLRPGIIIVDEEHDSSFKQQNGLRYHARDLALVRGRLENIPVILGSATASLESVFNARQKRYQMLHLPERAGNALQPSFHFVDLRQQKLEQGFAPVLLQTMQKHLQNQGQVLLFLNRRGFSPVTICHDCGWTADCQRCERKMTFHKKPAHLQCHYCGYRRPLDTHCPNCQGQQLFALGQGTQRLEQTLQKYFPSVGIVRIDRDNTQHKGSLDSLLKNIHEGESQILIGTQMLAKGHHFPNVTLVGILEADSGLFSADFRALERTGQLLTQVAGRAGRADKPGEVLIQTYHPEHPLLLHLIQQGYLSFSDILLQERRASLLPPFSYLVLIHAEALSASYPNDFLNEVKHQAKPYSEEVRLLGPVPSLLPRRAGYYRCQLLLQASQRKPLHRLLEQIIKPISLLASSRRVRWSLDVDPIELF
ncbi:MAG: primosomal protein N' [Candidatus Aquirickettsiella gammari]|uniref:Replication restart protein PriA n=1 Tax=Candidatus Aquirickettsiella gammari TaxID=2016198 RepID=A0A370CHA3_9COXI|nr:MAG: primosomal protein N' [Candidatus Aquirickettsiella gammari]